MTTRMFGERVERREDRRFLTGRGRYVADFELEAAHASRRANSGQGPIQAPIDQQPAAPSCA